MISRPYVAYLFRRHRVLLLAAFVFLAAFQLLILALVERADLVGLVERLVQRMPPEARQLLGDEILAPFSVAGAIALGYNHPFVLVTLVLVAVVLPARHVAGEVEDGTLELLLSLPVRRTTIACSLWLSSAAALFLLLVACWLGTGVGLWRYPAARTVTPAALFRLGFHLWLLVLAVGSYALLFSAFAREGGRAGLRAAGLTLFFYFLSFAVVLWPAVAWMRPFTLFTYYRALPLLTGAAGWGVDTAVLAAVALVSGTLAVVRIARRDVPG